MIRRARILEAGKRQSADRINSIPGEVECGAVKGKRGGDCKHRIERELHRWLPLDHAAVGLALAFRRAKELTDDEQYYPPRSLQPFRSLRVKRDLQIHSPRPRFLVSIQRKQEFIKGRSTYALGNTAKSVKLKEVPIKFILRRSRKVAL